MVQIVAFKQIFFRVFGCLCLFLPIHPLWCPQGSVLGPILLSISMLLLGDRFIHRMFKFAITWRYSVIHPEPGNPEHPHQVSANWLSTRHCHSNSRKVVVVAGFGSWLMQLDRGRSHLKQCKQLAPYCLRCCHVNVSSGAPNDTTVVIVITKNNRSAHRKEVEQMTAIFLYVQHKNWP